MENTNHWYTQRRPALRRRIACVLCWILLFQGYPLLALRESGGGFYLRDLSAVIDGDLLDWELPELPDVRWPADEDSGSEPEEPHQVARLGGGALVARGMSQLGWGYFAVPQAPPSPPSHRDEEAQTPPFDPEKAAKAFESPLDGISLVPGWNLVSLPEEPADTGHGDDRRAESQHEVVGSNHNNFRPDYPMPLASQQVGVQAFAQIFRGGQVWVYVRLGVIINAGVNRTGAFR